MMPASFVRLSAGREEDKLMSYKRFAFSLVRIRFSSAKKLLTTPNLASARGPAGFLHGWVLQPSHGAAATTAVNRLPGLVLASLARAAIAGAERS